MVKTDLNLLGIGGSRNQPQMFGFIEAGGGLSEAGVVLLRLNHVAFTDDRRLVRTGRSLGYRGFRRDSFVHRFDDGDGSGFLRGRFDAIDDLAG